MQLLHWFGFGLTYEVPGPGKSWSGHSCLFGCATVLQPRQRTLPALALCVKIQKQWVIYYSPDCLSTDQQSRRMRNADFSLNSLDACREIQLCRFSQQIAFRSRPFRF